MTGEVANLLIEVGNTALKAAFSETPPTAAEIKQCRHFADEFAKSIYAKSGRLRKIYLRFINVII